VDLALKLDVLAVCAVFAFVGAILLGAFWVQEADDTLTKNTGTDPDDSYSTGEPRTLSGVW